MPLTIRMSLTKTQGLFMFCIALYIFAMYTIVTHRGVTDERQAPPWESDITPYIRGNQLRQHQNESFTAHQMRLGSNISNALYQLYMANGRPVETSLLITNNQAISIVAIDGDYEDYKDVHVDDNSDNLEDMIKPADEGGNRLEGEEKFLYSWNEWDPVGWMDLPLALGKQDEKAMESPAVMFNRVGKCGSRSVLSVFQKLAKKNRFYLVSSLTHNKTKLEPSLEKQIVKVSSSLKRPYLLQRHVHFIDYTRHQMPQPLYINIIRDPLERMVSQYYYARFGDDRGKGDYKGNALYQTFDECVLSRSLECLGRRTFYIIPYFCGQDYNCTHDQSWAFKKAVENLDKYYIATGILEELEDTFRVFEKVLPSFFKGALDIYQSQTVGEPNLQKQNTSTKHKIKPSPEVSKFMKEHLKMEFKFYELVKQRFHDQKRKLGIV